MTAPRDTEPRHVVIAGPVASGKTTQLRREIEAHHGRAQVVWVYTTAPGTMAWPVPGQAGWAPHWVEDHDPAAVLSAARHNVADRQAGGRRPHARDVMVALDDPGPDLFQDPRGEPVTDLLYVLEHGPRVGVVLVVTWQNLDALPPALVTALERHAEVRRLPGHGWWRPRVVRPAAPVNGAGGDQ
jgi:hypothetical protein